MRYSAMVEDYWQEWSGEPSAPEGFAWFFAQIHVDPYHPPVYKSLARTVQLSGLPSSLQEAYRMIDAAVVFESFAGHVDESPDFTRCDAYGYTEAGELVDDVFEITIVEIPTNV